MKVENPATADFVPDASSAPFFEGAARGELMLQHCESCGTTMWPVKFRCLACFGGRLSWQAASGRAELYSLVVVHQAYPGFAAPYVLATVETDEGVRFNSTIIGVDADKTEIGSSLEVVFDQQERPFPLPRFRTTP